MKLFELMQMQRIFTPHIHEDIPSATAYKLCKLILRAEEEAKVYAELMNKVIEQYAERGADGQIITDGGNIKMDESKKAEWQKAISKIQNIAVDYDVKFSLEDLSCFKLSISDMAAIKDYITED